MDADHLGNSDQQLPVVPTAESKATLFRKLANVMGKIGRIPKAGENTFHHYTYATASDVADAIRKAMAEENIAFLVDMVEIRQEPLQKGIRTHAKFEFTFACGETGATVTRHWTAEADDTGDKGINKVATAAEKYFLMKTFIVSTEDEPDTDGEEGLSKNPPARSRDREAFSRPSQQQQSSPQQQRSTPPSQTQTPITPIDWTTTGDWPKFLEWLASRKRNGQPAALTDTDALALVGAPNWFPTYPTIKAAAEAVAHELDKPAPEQPAQPKNPPKPTTSVPSGWTNESWTQLVDLCARDYNMTTDEMAKLLEVGNLRTVYPALPAAEVAIRNAAEKRQVPMCCYQATYHEVQSKKVVDLLGPNKALFRVFGGRENLTKLLGGADGKQFASENGLEAWELNKTYDIDGIRVSWQAEGRSNRKVLGLSLRVPYPPTDSESAAEDNVPTPPWEPPPGEGENLDDWFDDKKEEVLERTIST